MLLGGTTQVTGSAWHAALVGDMGRLVTIYIMAQGITY